MHYIVNFKVGQPTQRIPGLPAIDHDGHLDLSGIGKGKVREGEWTKISIMAGDPPEVSRGSVARSGGRPERINPAGGFGQSNRR